ncbi:hypothetical protein ACJVDH_15365 [Pedobacter sp. AW1-32]|uniref:hypothetical protein n=1 Tax=Pedobacter sp. AW1-32 TaxID=3383026 RepID=UPI003FEDF986
MNNPIDLTQAKDWFDNQLKSSKMFLKSNYGDSIKFSMTPDWQSAEDILINKETHIVVLPVKSNIDIVIKKGSNLILMIERKNGKFSSRLIDLAAETNKNTINYSFLYKQVFSSADMSNLSISFLNPSISAYPTSQSNRQSIMSIPEKTMAVRCTEWVLTTDYYVDGVWVGQTEQTIGVTCSGDIEEFVPDYGGTGGVTPTTDCSSETNSMRFMITNETVGNEIVGQNATTRVKNYDWKIAKQQLGLWSYVSHEQGTHAFTNNEWRWQSLEHKSITRTGAVVGGDISITEISATTTMGIYNTVMEVKFNLMASIACKGSPITTSNDYSASKLFYVND